MSPRSSMNESPDANEYFGKWDSRSPSPTDPSNFKRHDVIWEDEQKINRAHEDTTRDNWYRDDWFNRQDQWHDDEQQQYAPRRQSEQRYQYHREMDDRHITRLRSPSPERPRWTNRDMLASQNRSLDRGMEKYFQQNFSTVEGAHPMGQSMGYDVQLPMQPLHGTALNGFATNALREASGIPAAGGRRLPKPPPATQRAVFMPNPNTPLPINTKPERLSTRNRRLPQIPSSSAIFGTNPTGTLTNSLFGFAKKLTSGPQPTQQQQHQQPEQPNRHLPTQNGFFSKFTGAQQQNVPVFPTAPPLKRTLPNSHSFGGGVNPIIGGSSPGQLRRSGRGAKLPMIPGTGPMAPNAPVKRQLPNRGGLFSRSLDNGEPPKLDTVLEAGRGVRKLPVPNVREASSVSGMAPNLGYDQMMLNGGAGPAPQPNGNPAFNANMPTMIPPTISIQQPNEDMMWQ